MAPEQAEGKAKQVGPLADVYALGAILYELLVGRPPFRGTTVLETLEQVKTAEPVPPSRLVPGLPRDAETIALKCLQKDPAKRYASAEALAEDLRRFLEDRPIRARRVSSAERLLRWGRRNKLVAGLLASLVVTLVAGLVVSTSQWIRAEANAGSRGEAGAGRRELYTSDMIAIQQAWEAGDIGRMGELLGRHIPTRPGQTDWRGFEWHVFWRRSEKARTRDPDAPAEGRRLGPGGDPGRSDRGRLDLRPREGPGPGHPLGCRDRLGAADLRRAARGTGRDVHTVPGPLPGRTGLRHGEPIRSGGPGRLLHQPLGCGDGRTCGRA